jgi:hypothetical protein
MSEIGSVIPGKTPAVKRAAGIRDRHFGKEAPGVFV